jgi:hypothetical protein
MRSPGSCPGSLSWEARCLNYTGIGVTFVRDIDESDKNPIGVVAE